MRSFKVTRIPDVEAPTFAYVDALELVCRSCEDRHGPERSGFIPGAAVGVGRRLICPFCGHPSVVPKKARWS